MAEINWVLNEDVEAGDPLDYRTSGNIIDSNGDSIDWSVAARPKRRSDLYIGQVRMRVGFALMDIARRDDIENVESAMSFVETEFKNIMAKLNGLVKSQMQSVLLEMVKRTI